MEFEQILKELMELGKKNGSVQSKENIKYYNSVILRICDFKVQNRI